MNKWILSIIISSFFLVGSLLGLSFSVVYGYYPTENSIQSSMCAMNNCSYVDDCDGYGNTRKLEENCWVTVFDLVLIYDNKTFIKEISYNRGSMGSCSDKNIECYFVLPDIYETLTVYKLSNLVRPIVLLIVFSFLSLTFLIILLYSIYRLKTSPRINVDYFVRN